MMKSQFLILYLICACIHSSTQGYEPQFNTTKKQLNHKRFNTETSLDLGSVQTSSGHSSKDTDVYEHDEEQEQQLKKTTNKQLNNWKMYLNNTRFNTDRSIDLEMETIFQMFLTEDVNKQDEEQEQQVKKICQNAINQFTFTLPNSNKSLTFQNEKLVDFMLFPGLVLTHINEEKVYLTDISFTIFPNRRSVFLNALYPGYPKISGIDVMQFLMTLCHICEYGFEVTDASDLSTPYMFLHHQNYYESVIYGKNEIIAENNRPIDHDEFLNCVKILLVKRIRALCGSCEWKLEQCQHKATNLQPENCPATKPWLGRFLYLNIFTTCFHAPFTSIPKKQYSISSKNLHDILNKPFIKHHNSYTLELKIKDYPEMLEGCQRDQLFVNLMDSFQICIEDTLLKEQKLNPFNIWKSSFPCVTDRIDSFLKYYI